LLLYHSHESRPEVIVARHMDINVLGMALVTNMVEQDSNSSMAAATGGRQAVIPNHKEVIQVASEAANDMRVRSGF
jgi:purine nucleoside phosphorylase